MSPTTQLLALLFPILALGAQGLAVIPRDDWAPKKYADCWSFFAPVTATGSTQNLSSLATYPANNQVWTEEVVRYNSKNSTIGDQILAAPMVNVTGTYNFFMEYCQPKNGTAKGIYQGVHGNSANAAYWDFYVDGDDNEYSFVDAAAKEGWASLIYDRLGVGRTDHPDGINVVQVGYEIAQAIEIGRLIRSGGLGNGVPAYNKIVALGHSFGSLILLGTASVGPDTFDGMVLTGAAGDLASQDPDAILGVGGGQVLIASTIDAARFGSLSNDYMVTANPSLLQQGFLYYGNYTQQAFDTFAATVGENSIGQIRTGNVPFILGDRKNFTVPTFVIAGQYDAPACLANCYITKLPFPNQVAAAKLFFPSVAESDFEWNIVPDTGHGINFHLTAPLAYEQIFNFVSGHF